MEISERDLQSGRGDTGEKMGNREGILKKS